MPMPRGSELEQLRSQLIEPLLGSKPINVNAIEVEVARPGSVLSEQAAQVVNFGYSARYGDGTRISDLAHDAFSTLPSSNVLVARQLLGGQDVVLGTFRVVTGGKTEAEELFDLPQEYQSMSSNGHEKKRVAELGRFALHPIVTDKQQKREILRHLWSLSFRVMSELAVEVPLFVLAPGIHEFVTEAGIQTTLVTAQPSKSEFSRRTRTSWPRYWLPDEPREQQPSVYIAHAELLDLPVARERIHLPQFMS